MTKKIPQCESKELMLFLMFKQKLEKDKNIFASKIEDIVIPNENDNCNIVFDIRHFPDDGFDDFSTNVILFVYKPENSLYISLGWHFTRKIGSTLESKYFTKDGEFTSYFTRRLEHLLPKLGKETLIENIDFYPTGKKGEIKFVFAGKYNIKKVLPDNIDKEFINDIYNDIKEVDKVAYGVVKAAIETCTIIDFDSDYCKGS